MGNVFNFILTWWFVRSNEGHLFLRIDDVDPLRTKDPWLEDIFQTLAWLNMDYDGGPQNVDDLKKNYSQQNKQTHYKSFLQDHEDIFRCWCSRKSVDEKGFYQGRCFERTSHLVGDFALRCKLPPYYPVLWRKDDVAAYHLTSLVDDQDLGVNCLVRGDDLLSSSLVQKELANLLGLQWPSHVYHHETLKEENGSKMSKTQGARSLRDVFRTRKELFDFIANKLKVEPFEQLQELKARPFPKEVLVSLT